MHHVGGIIDAHVGLGISNGANKLAVELGHLSDVICKRQKTDVWVWAVWVWAQPIKTRVVGPWLGILVAQCSATPASVAATPPCSATPFRGSLLLAIQGRQTRQGLLGGV